MLLYPAALAAGVLAGYAAGGRLRHLGSVRLRHGWLLGAAVAVQLGLGGVPAGARFGLAMTSHAMAGAWVLANAGGAARRLRVPLLAVAAGWLANVAVMALNGGMPVSRAAMAAAGLDGDLVIEEGHLFKHVELVDGTQLAWLGDVIPLAPFRSVLSAGDVVMLAGIAAFVVLAMRRRPAAGTEEAGGWEAAPLRAGPVGGVAA